MSKRVLILLAVGLAAIVAAFLFLKYELTKQDPEQELEPEPEQEPEQEQEPEPTKGEIFAARMKAAREAKEKIEAETKDAG